MGQVVSGIKLAGYGLLWLAWQIWKLLRSVSARHVRSNTRLRTMAETRSGEEYVRGIASLVVQNASEAARAAEEAQRQSEHAIQEKVMALRRETELAFEVGRAKRRQQTIQAECDASQVVVFRHGHAESRATPLDEARRETDRLQEEVRKARQHSIKITKNVKVAQAAVDKTAREAAESARVAKEAQEAAEEHLKKGIQPVIIPTLDEIAAAKARVQYEEGRFHFAVAGVAGSGKSSFINAIRGVDTRHQDSAEIGVVETTVTIGRYPDPNPDLPFVWYDIPGAGTLQQPDWLYFNTQGLFVFDCLVVLFDNRFTQTDIAILRNCRRFQIPTYIVRSKADIHIRNLMYKDGYDSDHDNANVRESLFPSARRKFIADTRENVKRNLNEAGLPDQRVYMVSNKTLLSIVKDRSLRSPHKIIDELELIKDVIDEAFSHRCGTRANDDD
ncbi:interferon-inducible GTPase-domain-containing protein [Pisolithus marmoratus]|nr:interferon-inducible GTPase-domain-containing protein [Pisolithus marmoratus]